MDEQEIQDLLGNLETPEMPTALVERINYALAAEAVARQNQLQDPLPISDLASSQTNIANPPVNNYLPDALASIPQQRSSRPARILGIVAAVAAVGVFGLAGVQIFNASHPEDTALATNIPTNQQQLAEGSTKTKSSSNATTSANKSVPVVASGTSFVRPQLREQVREQIPKWKFAYRLAQEDTDNAQDVNLDGAPDSKTEIGSKVKQEVTTLRGRLSSCLSSIDSGDEEPLIVDIAELSDSLTEPAQDVAVIAFPKGGTDSQDPASYKVYFVGASCDENSADVLAQLTVANKTLN